MKMIFMMTRRAARGGFALDRGYKVSVDLELWSIFYTFVRAKYFSKFYIYSSMVISETTGILLSFIIAIVVATGITALIAKIYKPFQYYSKVWKLIKYLSLFVLNLIITPVIIVPILNFTFPRVYVYTISISTTDYEQDGKIIQYHDTLMRLEPVYGPKNSYIDNQTNIRFGVKMYEDNGVTFVTGVDMDSVTLYMPKEHGLPEGFTIVPNGRTDLPKDYKRILDLNDFQPIP